MRAKLVVLLGGVVLGVIGGLVLTFLPEYGRGSGGQFLIAVLLAVFVCAPAGLVALVAFAVSRKLSWIGAVALSLTLATLFVGASYVPGRVVASRDIKKARQYCESLIPALEAHKERTGSYPDTLHGMLPRDRRMPLLLRESQFYTHHGGEDSFSFEFHDPRSFVFGDQVFFSRSRDWRAID